MSNTCSSFITVNTAGFAKIESVDAIERTSQMGPGEQKHEAHIPAIPHTSNESHCSLAEAPSVTLPPELWTMIICNLDGPSQDDLAFLWMTVRNVSKSLRNEVERVFTKEHIGKTKLIGDCGLFCCCCNTFYFDRQDYLEVLNLKECRSTGSHHTFQRLDATPFKFSHLDKNDLDRAIFATIKDDQESAERAFRGICYKLGYRDKDALIRISKQLSDIGQRPPRNPLDEEHTENAASIFQLRGGFSDCIMGTKLNTESLEVSIDWKATLTVYYGRRLAASEIDMLACDPDWPREERPETLWGRGERRSITKSSYDRANDELQLRFLQEQVRAWRAK